jgi:predicted Zn-dependent protease
VPIDQAYVCLNPKSRWKTGFDGNLDVYDLRHTFTHEVGHAIGLDHPDSTGAVMAFRYDERVRDLQPSDIAGVQRLYGAHAAAK